MSRPTLAALRQLRDSLSPWSEQQPLPEGWAEYSRYYGLDFEGRFAALTHRAGVVESGGYCLAVQCWQAPSATRNLVLLHGYTDHTGLFRHLIEYGLATGCNVLIFDLPGHGLSTGEPAAIDDFGEYAQALADVLAAVTLPALPTWTMAQSTGCSVLMEYARRNDWPFQATVLLAPLLRPAEWHRVRIAWWLLRSFTKSIPRSFNRNSSDEAFLEFIQQDPLQPTRVPLRWIGALKRWLGDLPLADLGAGPALVLQGDQDGTVDWRYNTGHIDRLFAGSEIQFLPEAGHQLANESMEIRSVYLDQVSSYVEPKLSRVTESA
ncbi:MAG: alpha/beta hydrolase [Halieaceae bacterium]